MLYICYRNPRAYLAEELKWHVGEENPIAHEQVELVFEVQACGDELNMILRRFINLPKVDDSSTQRWFGDHARFIVGNL